jgi:hypothetical protein
MNMVVQELKLMYTRLEHCITSDMPTHLTGDMIMPEHVVSLEYNYDIS